MLVFVTKKLEKVRFDQPYIKINKIKLTTVT